MRVEAENWWSQAQYDLKAAEANIGCKQYYVAVFLSQQAAEKALKGLYIERHRALHPPTHTLQRLGNLLDVPESVMEGLIELNPDYVTTRYPDAANGVPAEQYTERSARLHYQYANEVLKWVREQISTQSQ